MEARGISTDKGNYNREVRKYNSFIQSVISQICKLKEEIAEIIKRENEIDKALADPNNLAISELLLQYADARKKKDKIGMRVLKKNQIVKILLI